MIVGLRLPVLLVVGVALAAPTSRGGLHAQNLSYTGSVQYSTGNYIFTERTNSLYLVNGLSASTGQLRLSATVPVILQSTPWVTYGGTGPVPSGGTQHSQVQDRMGRGRMGGRSISLPDTTRFEEIGLGDPLFHAGVELWGERDLRPSLSLTADLKAPIADVDRGFGTGEWDYAGGVSLVKSFGRTFVFADLSYWVLGDLSDLELQDPFAYGLSLGRTIGDGRWGLLAGVSGYTEIVPDVDPPLQATLGVSYFLEPGRSLNGSLGFGLSESSPELSTSLGWRIPL